MKIHPLLASTLLCLIFDYANAEVVEDEEPPSFETLAKKQVSKSFLAPMIQSAPFADPEMTLSTMPIPCSEPLAIELEVTPSLPMSEGIVAGSSAPLLTAEKKCEPDHQLPQPSKETSQFIAATYHEQSIVNQVDQSLIDPYSQLPITEEEKEMIASLLTTMANNSVFKLLFEKKRLEKIGRQIHHIHPLRFLGTVFSNAKLTRCMREIRKSGFKWEGFIDGFSGRMVEESSRNNLIPYIQGFAKEVGVEPVELLPFLEGSDFEGLIRKLLKLTN